MQLRAALSHELCGAARRRRRVAGSRCTAPCRATRSCSRLNELLAQPRALHELPRRSSRRPAGTVSEAEILSWLTLGAAAQVDGRPLLRPVVHGFVRGISGAVVSFPDGDSAPQLWLAAEDESRPVAATAIRPLPRDHLHDLRPALLRRAPEGLRVQRKGARGRRRRRRASFWEPLEETLRRQTRRC